MSVLPPDATLGPTAQQSFRAVVAGSASIAVSWTVRQGSAGGVIDANGLYTAPATPGTYQVVATEPTSGLSGEATINVTSSCWQLPTVNRVRLYPRAGSEAALVGGVIAGSNDGPTTNFTPLATVSSAAPGWNDITFANATPYRWIKYASPAGSYGQIAELEFYSGATRIDGAGFGTTGGTTLPWSNALDGNTASYFQGMNANDNYVGLDAADGHVTAAVTMSPPPGTYSASQSVTLSSSTPGATIRFTLDGSDPTTGAVYTGPITVSTTTTVRAMASSNCAANSEGSTGLYTVGGGQSVDQSIVLMGNSLTDSVDSGFLTSVAAAGGVNLRYQRFTQPGIGTHIYPGSDAARSYVRSTPADSISFQPAENMPCLPYGSGQPAGENSDDATNIDLAWDDAQPVSPAVTMWIYATWPAPSAADGWANGAGCIEGDGWVRDSAIWNPQPNPPTSYEMSVERRRQYAEVIRTYLISLHPTRASPYIVQGGSALAALKARIQAGTFPGLGASAWPGWVYNLAYAGDDHLTNEARYLITLLFYSSMFQKDPRALPDTNLGTPATLTTAQAAALQDIAYQVVNSYSLSGYGR